MKVSQANIQVQDPAGIWRTVSVVPYQTWNLQMVQREMDSVQRRYKRYRVRAVDKFTGGFVDLST